MDRHEISRRAFLATATTTAITFTAVAKPNTAKVVPRKLSPNEKLNIAGIGAGGKGTHDILSMQRENIVALCDIDWSHAQEVLYRLPKAKRYSDYRKMLDEMGDQIDACTVSTPDHTHAPAAYRAMKLGKHVYVQKPLTHTIAEARLLTKTAREMKVVTQMGNQGHSGDGVRDLAEMLWAGAVGPVREVHIWTDRPGKRWPQGGTGELPPVDPIPEGFEWDLWLGTAASREFSKLYAPDKWRGWIDFGCGGLGDMACHIMDPAFFALKLEKAATFSVEVVRAEEYNERTWPNNVVLKYTFPSREDMPPVTLYWYENGQKPSRPTDIPEGQKIGDGDNGSLFVGDKGYLTAGEYGGEARLLPNDRMKAYTRPAATIPRIPGGNHYRSFVTACKEGTSASSHFDYAGPFTEMVLMGTIAQRVNRKVDYDTAAMAITNDPEAHKFITKTYRKGWELPV